MIAILAILLALLQPAPPDPQLRAAWDTSTSATVRWQQVARSCLYHENERGAQVFVACYDAPGSYAVTFGHVGPLSGDLRPMKGDSYVLTSHGQTWRAPLRWWLYMPSWRA